MTTIESRNNKYEEGNDTRIGKTKTSGVERDRQALFEPGQGRRLAIDSDDERDDSLSTRG